MENANPQVSYRLRRKGRELAMQTLYQVAWDALSPDEAKNLVWLDRKVEDEARNFASLLVVGTLSHLEQIDGVIRRTSSHWKIDRIPMVDLAILRISIFALLHLAEEIPAKVTINEAIEISKKYSSEDSWKYMNGMLDAVYISISAQPGQSIEG